MKNLFILALALIMTSTFVFAQTETPYAKGKYYGEQIIEIAIYGDDEDLEELSNRMGYYVGYNIETEEQLTSFFDGFEAGVRKACDDYGLDKEFADTLLASFMESYTKGLESSL